MKPRLEYKLANNRAILQAVADPETPAKRRVRRRGETATHAATYRLANARLPILPAAIAVLSTFPDLNTANDLALVVSIKFQANVGTLLVSAGWDATVRMLLKWVKKR